MSKAHSEDYKGYNLELFYDDMPDNPISWAEADERGMTEGKGVYFALQMSRHDLPYEITASTGDYDSWRELAEAVTKKGGELAGYVYQFVSWYEHSGVVVSLTDTDKVGGWDSGCAGVIFGGSTKDIASYFAEWKAYTEGDVYGITVTAPDGNEVTNTWGYYGYDDAIQAAKDEADADAKLTGIERIKVYGRGHAPNAHQLHR